jgi:hypothetical protein
MKDDPTFQIQVRRLYQLTVYARWLVVSILWLTVGSWSIWTLRREIGLWLEYFTWSAVRYALAYNRLAAVGLGLCLGATTAVLVWQSSNILWGLPPEQQRRLERQVRRIRERGSSHPLWKWVCREDKSL